MTDEQVLARALTALQNVTSYRVGSTWRAEQWDLYSEAKAELDRRLFNHVLRKLGEKR